MSQLFLIRGAKQLLTLHGPPGPRRGAALQDLGIIEDGSLLIRDGVIIQVGTTRRIENLKMVRGAAEIDASGAIVMPGFVDPGMHLRPAPSLARRKRKKISNFYDESLALMRVCLQHGTLNAQVKASMQTEALDSGISLLRQLAHIGDSPVGMVRSWRIERGTGKICPFPAYTATFGTLAKRKLAHRVDVSTSSSIGDEELLRAATANRLGINLHWPGGPPNLLLEMLQRFNPVSVTCPYDLTIGECDVLSGCKSPVVFSPLAGVFTEKPSRAARLLADSGVAIALSSGYDSDQMPVFNMQMAVALSVIRMQLNTEEAICSATINAAYAAGIGNVVGSLESGKRADLLMINLPDYREMPKRFGVNHVGMAIRQGKVVYNRIGRKVSAA